MSCLLFLLAFAYYLIGLSGTVPSYRDSGDLIASIHTLGIAHPPGYALYVLLGKLFVTLVPFGNVAYRVNVMSAFFAAVSVVILFKTLRYFAGPSSYGAFIVTLLYAASPAVIALARVAEMYTLSACLASAILYCLLSEHPKGPAWAALLLGLGLSVHPTLIFLAPLFFITPERSMNRSCGLYFLLGLSIFLYLPIRAAQHPLVNWGDPSHWRNFWRVVTRADYGGFKLHPEQSVFSWTPESILAQLKYFLLALKGEWGWVGIVLGLGGILITLRDSRGRSWAVPLLVSWILSGPGFFLLSNLPLTESTTPAILQPYLLLVSVLWVPFVGMGIAPSSLLLLPQGGEGNLKKDSLAPRRGERVWVRGGGIVIVILGASLFSRTLPPSQRYDFFAYDYARNLLRSLPPGAVLYDPDDPTHFSIQVLQLLENRRTDVVLLNFFRTRWGYEQIKRRWPDLLPPIPIDNGQELQHVLWSYSARQRPFYAELPQKFGPIPYRDEGLVYAALAGSSAASRERAETLMKLYVQRGDFVTTHQKDFFTRHVVSYYAAAHNNLGIEYANTGDWRHAVEHYRAALQLEPDQSAARQNLAIALQKMPKLL